VGAAVPSGDLRGSETINRRSGVSGRASGTRLNAPLKTPKSQKFFLLTFQFLNSVLALVGKGG
jgi:hypothetical protein